MSNEIYTSTGTFIGRANGCEPDVIKREAPNIKCDGFELMLLSAWYDDFFKIIDRIASFDIYFPVIHFEKGIGILLAENTEESIKKALENFSLNVEAAKRVGAKKRCFICGAENFRIPQ